MNIRTILRAGSVEWRNNRVIKFTRADIEFKKWLDSFLVENGEILNELAKR